MDILSFGFIVLVLVVAGYAWVRLRSNWRSVQSMRASRKAPADEPGFDLRQVLMIPTITGMVTIARIMVATR